MQTTILGWLGLGHNTSSGPQAATIGPPRTTQQIGARQPHSGGTFALSGSSIARSPNVSTTAAARRSRRLAEEIAELDVRPPVSTPDQRQRRTTTNQQDFPSLPSAEFTFTSPHPAVSAPDLPSLRFVNMGDTNSQQNMAQSSMHHSACSDDGTDDAFNAPRPGNFTTRRQSFASTARANANMQAYPQVDNDPTTAAVASSRLSSSENTTMDEAVANAPIDSESQDGDASQTTADQAPLSSTTGGTMITRAQLVHGHEEAPPPRPTRISSEQEVIFQSKSCVNCEDEDEPLVQICLMCDYFWCADCIKRMFEVSSSDMTRMPARCCTIVQLPVALPHLTAEQADLYRARFEEWVPAFKLYCPVPTCSAFISERYTIPPSKRAPIMWEVLQPHLLNIIRTLKGSKHGHYVLSLTSPNRQEITDYFSVVHNPIFLDTIERRLKCCAYTSLNTFMLDMRQFFSNLQLFKHGKYNDLSMIGDHLEILFWIQWNDIKVEISPAEARSLPKNACFACPKCSIGICPDCKQIAHPLKPCDTTMRDYETGIMVRYGYRQCPKCGHAVKKMYGCKAMECRCGALWCWICRQSMAVCESEGCDDDDDDDDYDEDEDEHDYMRDTLVEDNGGVTPDASHARIEAGSQTQAPVEPAQRLIPQSAQRQPDLDAGGEVRWGQAPEYFGDEPSEDNGRAVWACKHDIDAHEIASWKIENGYPLQLECNRCFTEVHAQNAGGKPQEGKALAYYCEGCSLVVCRGCKKHLDQVVDGMRLD